MSDDQPRDADPALGPFLSRLLSRTGGAVHGTRDRWVGTRELPGYRAGDLVVRLADLPGVDAQHLYLDVLLLDADGQTVDTLSGPCHVLGRDDSVDTRAHFVRICAELLRDAPDEVRGLAPLGPVLAFVRQYGVDGSPLQAAAQLLDRIADDAAVAAQLERMLLLSIGEDEAATVLAHALDELLQAGRSTLAPAQVASLDLGQRVQAFVRIVGKAHARELLRDLTDFPLLPTGELYGL